MTLGEKLVANIEKQLRSPDKQEAGETIHEMGKDFMGNIYNCIQNARSKGVKGVIYVHVLERAVQFAQNAVHHKIFVRRTRPTPEQATYLFSHSEGDSNVVFEYCLPELSHVLWIFAHKDQYTDKYLKDVRDWLAGKLT